MICNYEMPHAGDGFRVLVGYLWTRGTSKQSANISLWPRDIAPSTVLRNWYGHSTSHWHEFKRRYLLALEDKPEELDLIGAALK